MTVTYLLPTGQPQEILPYGLSHPLEGSGLTIGLLSNGFPDTEPFLERLADALAPLLPGTRFRIETKGPDQHLSDVVRDPQLSDLSDGCQAMVIAWGHCGSCTAGVTRDAMAFAAKGVPSVTLICDVFWDYSAWMANAIGMPDLPRVRIPYPVAGSGEARQRAVAAEAAPEIVQHLRAGS